MTPDPAVIPISGRVITTALSLLTISVLAFCLTRRIQSIRSWRGLPLQSWLTLAIYTDSFLFIFLTALLSKSWSLNQSQAVCEGAILLCLICYMTTKVLIYYFLVEKAYIIRGSRINRLKDRLYLFNFFGVICPYAVVIVLNFVFRIAYINEGGTCIIGMRRLALIPLISFEVFINVYLTSLFLNPLRKLYSYKHGTNNALKTMAFRSFIGSCTTLVASVTNLTVLTALDGEPGWICLMLCNLDILFTAVVLHWVTSIDRQNSSTSYATPNRRVSNFVEERALSGQPGGIDPKHDFSAAFAKQKSGTKGGRGPITTNIEADRDVINEHIPMDKIVVKTHQIQEHEIGGEESSEERSETSANWCYSGHARNGSQDGIVPRPAEIWTSPKN